MQQEIWFGKYRILHLLGSGGTARVYLAQHIKLNSYRAIKCISKNNPLYDLQRNEAFILKNLKHPGIPIIYDIEEDEEGSYIVEQYLEGETLKEYISSNGPIREDILVYFAIQLCDLVGYLHDRDRPILYADLKPENIIISGKTLKLVDFGSAVYLDELQEEPKLTGTRGFAAPELYRKSKVDERCDVYGIGMLIYYMASGSLISQDNIDRIKNCSKQLKTIMNRCLRFQPAGRYATVAQLKKQLSVALDHNLSQEESSQPRTIAIAGAGPRIGVTHLAFRLCSYLRQNNISCLYLEKNQSGCIRSISKYQNERTEENCYRPAEISILHKEGSPEQELENLTLRRAYTVLDYGGLTSDNLEDFLKAEVKLLVMGAKEWELTRTEEVLSMVTEYKEIFYLFNFLNGKQYGQVVENMEHKSCYRIPYEPDPFAKITDRGSLALFEELLESGRKRRYKTGSVLFGKRRRRQK